MDWFAGASLIETANNIKTAIITRGLQYDVQVIDNVILVSRGQEDTLAVSSNTSNIEVLTYSASYGKIYIKPGTFTKNELANLVLKDGNDNTYFIKSNDNRTIVLFNSTAVIENAPFFILPNFNNSYPAGYVDSFRNYIEALNREGSGLDPESYYYYTVFTTPPLLINIVTNETSLGNNIQARYTVDKIKNYITRIFYEDIIFTNQLTRTFTYDPLTGDITYSDGVDLTEFNLQVGDLFADDLGQRFPILDLSQQTSGIVTLATGLALSTAQRTRLHGSITRPVIPVGLGAVQVGDVFKDLGGNSFQIIATNSQPLIGLTTPPSNSFDIQQGLIDDVVFKNNFIVPYSYDPATGIIQYGEEQIALNQILTSFTYNSISGQVIYLGPMNLTQVQIGDLFVDGVNNQFVIRQILPSVNTLILDTSLSVNNTVVNSRDGSIVRKTQVIDESGFPLVNLTNVKKFDLLKTNSKALFNILDKNVSKFQLFIDAGITSIATLVQGVNDGSIIRRGKEVAWVGFDKELDLTLSALALAGVRRFNSLYEGVYAPYTSVISTQIFALNPKNRKIGDYLYKLWPQFFRTLDQTGDLEDLMQVFGKEMNEMFGVINTLELQNPDLIIPPYLSYGAASKSLPLVSESLGIDTQRRVMRDYIAALKQKGTRDGIARFIKIITTWDITNGTGDLLEAIIDDTPETISLRFYGPSLGTNNTRLVNTEAVISPPAGRFYKAPPGSGISLPGFFKFREVIINLPNVALEIGTSTGLGTLDGNSTISDLSANFGADNSLKGSYLIPNEGAPEDFYLIIGNTSSTITVQGSVPQTYLGAKYVILSPLNMNRFLVIQRLINEFLPHNAKAVFNFTITKL